MVVKQLQIIPIVPRPLCGSGTNPTMSIGTQDRGAPTIVLSQSSQLADKSFEAVTGVLVNAERSSAVRGNY